MPEHLELPRPLRLLRTTVWSLLESAGLPVAAIAVGGWLGGRNAGLAATWLHRFFQGAVLRRFGLALRFAPT